MLHRHQLMSRKVFLVAESRLLRLLPPGDSPIDFMIRPLRNDLAELEASDSSLSWMARKVQTQFE